MTPTDYPSIPDLLRETAQDPDSVARKLLKMDLPANALWLAFALVIVFSSMLSYIPVILAPLPEDSGDIAVASPLLMSFVQASFTLITVFLVHWIGRMFGGVGSFEGSLTIVTWIQFVMVCFQFLQLVVTVLSPGFGLLLLIAGVIIFFYLLTRFVTVLHGFTNPAMVFAGIFASMIGVAFFFFLILGPLGLVTEAASV